MKEYYKIAKVLEDQLNWGWVGIRFIATDDEYDTREEALEVIERAFRTYTSPLTVIGPLYKEDI